jgi:hypothetical protein
VISCSALQAVLYLKDSQKIDSHFSITPSGIGKHIRICWRGKGKNLTSGMCPELSECAVIGPIIIDSPLQHLVDTFKF